MAAVCVWPILSSWSASVAMHINNNNLPAVWCIYSLYSSATAGLADSPCTFGVLWLQQQAGSLQPAAAAAAAPIPASVYQYLLGCGGAKTQRLPSIRALVFHDRQTGH